MVMSTGTPRTAQGTPILWKPWPGFQVRSLQCSADEALLGGAAGPGKTDLLIYGALRFAHKPWCRALLLRKYLEEMGEIQDRLGEVIPKAFPGAKFEERKRRWKFPAGGWLRFGYAKNRKDLDQYLGNQYTYIGVDELGHWQREEWWTLLTSRLRSPDPEGAQFCFARGTANPGGQGHAWMKKRFITPCGKDGARIYVDPITKLSRAFVPGRLADNPILANDPVYVGRLMQLPEVLRKQMLYGDWDAAIGLAFEEIDHDAMVVPARKIPSSWNTWGGFDWGFSHPAVAVQVARDENGQRYVVDTVWMRRLQPDQIAETVWERLPLHDFSAIYCGADIKQEHNARRTSTATEDVPTIEEVLTGQGWPCADAAITRKPGYSYLRDLLSFRRRGPGKTDITPQLLFFDTPGNLRLLKQLESLVVDPDNPEDVLKINADPSSGEGGDDGYDALRYALVSHQRPGRNPRKEEQTQAFGDEALRYEVELRRVGNAIKKNHVRNQKGDASWW